METSPVAPNAHRVLTDNKPRLSWERKYEIERKLWSEGLSVTTGFEIGRMLNDELNPPDEACLLEESQLPCRDIEYDMGSIKRALRALGPKGCGPRSKLFVLRLLAARWTDQEAWDATAVGMSLNNAAELLRLDNMVHPLLSLGQVKDAKKLRKARAALARRLPFSPDGDKAWMKWRAKLEKVRKTYEQKVVDARGRGCKGIIDLISVPGPETRERFQETPKGQPNSWSYDQGPEPNAPPEKLEPKEGPDSPAHPVKSGPDRQDPKNLWNWPNFESVALPGTTMIGGDPAHLTIRFEA